MCPLLLQKTDPERVNDMIRTKFKPVLVMSALIAISPAAFALDGAELYKTKTCLTCHGKDGKTTIMPSYPKIAGQNEAYVLQQLKDIKSGARANGMSAAMKGIMHLVSDEEMEALAKYISTMQP
jgi:cytochrome c